MAGEEATEIASDQATPRAVVAYLGLPGGEAFDPQELPGGVRLAAVVQDEEPGERSGLARALKHIASGEADTLYVRRLHVAARSLGELIRLLEWLGAADAHLLATDVELDTATADGRRAVALVRELERWGREPELPRRPRGRPGLVAGSPALAERIALMRERGLSLQAIATALNDEGVPTPRGGARWRPSSVQSALGYRRPRPPAPGAPPPPPHPGPPRGGPGHRHAPGPRRSPGR